MRTGPEEMARNAVQARTASRTAGNRGGTAEAIVFVIRESPAMAALAVSICRPGRPKATLPPVDSERSER